MFGSVPFARQKVQNWALEPNLEPEKCSIAAGGNPSHPLLHSHLSQLLHLPQLQLVLCSDLVQNENYKMFMKRIIFLLQVTMGKNMISKILYLVISELVIQKFAPNHLFLHQEFNHICYLVP